MTKAVIFFSRNEMVLNSSLITAIIHARARFRFAVLCGIVKQLLSITWMSTLKLTWNNHIFHHWCIFTIRHLVLLLLCESLNFVTYPIYRNALSNGRKRSNVLQNFSKSNMHVFVCTYAFYFCLLSHFCATSYLLVKSVKVLCTSICDNSFVHLSAYFSLTFHFHCKIWLWHVLLSVATIITITVKLLQMIWGYVISFLVRQSLCLFFVSLKDIHFTWCCYETCAAFMWGWNPSR